MTAFGVAELYTTEEMEHERTYLKEVVQEKDSILWWGGQFDWSKQT